MALDDLVLGLQHLVDRLVRRLRLGPPPSRRRRRLVIVQIDGLSRAVLELGIAQGRMPFLSRLLQRTPLYPHFAAYLEAPRAA